MEFFSREIRAPDADLLSMLTSIGNQIGLFVDRRRAQEELDRFFMLCLDMLAVAGFDGYFKRVNPAWQRVLGYTEEELLSRPYMEFVHPDDRAATTVEARKLSETGQELLYFENRYFHKDGTLRWLMWTSTPFPEQQVIYGAARDITERKAAEETLASYWRELELSKRELEDQAARQAQLVKELEIAKHRAEAATEAKSAFLANMSHEVRTPLNGILGMTALALQTRLTAEQREYLTTVKSSADSLLEIINDILDFSKIEAQRLDLEHAELDLRETVGDAAKLLALRAAEKGIELACHITPDVPDMVLGDAGRLRQVLLNVLGNAVKFTSRRRGGAARHRPGRDREPRHAAFRGQRHRNRHPAGQAAADLPSLHAGRQLDDAALRWHRAGLGHRLAARRAHGRAALGREHGRPRQHVLFHGHLRTAASRTRTRRGRSRGNSKGCGSWWWTTTRRTAASSRRCS